MWYQGGFGKSGKENNIKIDHAISEDGIHWRRYPDKPVLEADQKWEGNAVILPSVLKIKDKYYMWYTSESAKETGMVISNDGIHWKKESTNRFFSNKRRMGFLSCLPLLCGLFIWVLCYGLCWTKWRIF